MKTVSYKDEIVEFKKTLASIGDLQKVKWTLDDVKKRFSNPLLDYIYFE